MTKSILPGTITFLSILFFMLSFKSADNKKKEYVTIYYNDYKKKISLSYSNGTFNDLEFQKPKGLGDETQLLKIINDLETQGYNIVNYEFKALDVVNHVGTALLSK